MENENELLTADVVEAELIQETADKNQLEPVCYFTEDNARRLSRLLGNKEDYCYYMKALWIFRDLLHNKIDSKNIASHPSFPILKTINDLMSCLFVDGAFFDHKGNCYTVNNGRAEYLIK